MQVSSVQHPQPLGTLPDHAQQHPLLWPPVENCSQSFRSFGFAQIQEVACAHPLHAGGRCWQLVLPWGGWYCRGGGLTPLTLGTQLVLGSVPADVLADKS